MDDKEFDELRFRDIIEQVTINGLEKGFWCKERNFGDMTSLIHSEVTEAFEEYRNGHGYNETYYEEDGKPCGIPSELADIILRTIDTALYLDIDIVSAIKEKMDYNKTRPYFHGNKIV